MSRLQVGLISHTGTPDTPFRVGVLSPGCTPAQVRQNLLGGTYVLTMLRATN